MHDDGGDCLGEESGREQTNRYIELVYGGEVNGGKRRRVSWHDYGSGFGGSKKAELAKAREEGCGL